MFGTHFRKKKEDFSEIVISLSSPQSVLARSHGKVTSSDTRNHRTYKPEKGGLFCECIFGPEEDWKCACGKYKGIKYKGNVCDRCGVEINEKKVRRERMGHIELVVPVAHVWFFRYLPNKMATLLGIPGKKLENLVYYSTYVVLQPGIKAEEGLEKMSFLTRREYYDLVGSIPKENKMLPDSDPNKVIIGTGAAAIERLLKEIDLDALRLALREQIENESSQQRKQEAIKRLDLVESFRSAQRKGVENRPEWMILRNLPVIPPDMRPSILLPNRKLATADITERYRAVIIRNKRLMTLMQIKAPDIILMNEKRMLQEAVDALFDDPTKVIGDRVLNSLSTSLKGKTGLFRKNLLGKRVDFSGRSVIVVGPHLKLHQCGVPKEMALELFKPFVINGLIDRGTASTPKEAKKIIENKEPVVFEVLKNQIKGHPVLLNRAPTLHRLSIQAFEPMLIEGKAIQLHPLVCTAFNADFDGDQMGIYVPLSQEAIAEAYILMLSSNNILNPSNGEPITIPSQDIILGLYYLTMEKKGSPDAPVKGEGLLFSSLESVDIAYQNKKVALHAPIELRARLRKKEGGFERKIIQTTVGRALFNQDVPEEIGYVNKRLDRKSVRELVAQVYGAVGVIKTAEFLDKIKNRGFEYSYKSGLTFNIAHIKVPEIKKELIQKAEEQERSVWESYYMGLITDTERYNQIIDIWTQVITKLNSLLVKELARDQNGFNPIHIMSDSGARGSRDQLGQMGCMKGLLATASKGIIEQPILESFIDGITPANHFRSASASRKGLSDTATKTADAGHLTRRLASVAQSMIITEEDCKTLLSKEVSVRYNREGKVSLSLEEQAYGRVIAQDVVDPSTGEVILKAGEEITREKAQKMDQLGIESIRIRAVTHCQTENGICIQCYGKDLGRNRMVQIGEPVGIIGASSIAEPGTQLTLRTFHSGGVGKSAMDDGVVRASFDGTIRLENVKIVKRKDRAGDEERIVLSRGSEIQIVDPVSGKESASFVLHYGSTLFVSNGDRVKKGDKLFEWDQYNVVILADISGQVLFESIEKGVTYKEEKDEQTGFKKKVIVDSRDKSKLPNLIIEGKSGEKASYAIPVNAYLSIEDKQKVEAGDILVKIPRSKGGLSDITGGLPLVNRIFEARQPFNPVKVSPINGIVSYGDKKRGNQEIIIRGKDGSEYRENVSLSDIIVVHSGDYVSACAPLSDGMIALNSILKVKGRDALYDHMIHEVQAIYRGQGVKIDDKHMEVILRQMTQKVKIVQTGDTWLLPEGVIDRQEFHKANEFLKKKKVVVDPGDGSMKIGDALSLFQLDEENKRLNKLGKRPATVRDPKFATASLVLQGITRAAISGNSFLAAAAFQDTIKVLSKAALSSSVDKLRGLHENVIMGRQIPAGTGIKAYNRVRVMSESDYHSMMNEKEGQEEES